MEGTHRQGGVDFLTSREGNHRVAISMYNCYAERLEGEDPATGC